MDEFQKLVVNIKGSARRIGTTKRTIAPEEGITFFDMLTPAFAGGIVIGLILGVPGVNFLLPMVPVGGWFAGRLLDEFYKKKIGKRSAIKLGAFAGIIGAFIATLVNIIVSILYAGGAAAVMSSFIDYRTSNLLLQLSGLDPYVSVDLLKLRFVANLLLGISLGCVGGLIYSKFSQKK